MRAFIVICFAAVACAENLGYNYQPVGASGSVGTSVSGGILGNSQGGQSFGSIVGANFGGGILTGLASNNVGSLSGTQSGLSSNNLGGFAVGNIGVGGNNGFTSDGSSYSAPAELQKEFYTFSAPESEFDDNNAAQKIAGSIKKGLRVIFIKSPENNALENAALALAKQAAAQKTAIYVLTKQTDIGALANKLNAIKTNSNNKPEVHFVKYRTPEDAVNAQKTIEHEYNALGGASQSHNGGAATVLNFASQAPVHNTPAQAPGNAYLPSSIFRN